MTALQKTGVARGRFWPLALRYVAPGVAFLASLPLGGWFAPAVWLAVVGTLLLLQSRARTRLRNAFDPALGAAYAIAAFYLLASGNTAGEVLATTMLGVALFATLVRYYGRTAWLIANSAPYICVIVAMQVWSVSTALSHRRPALSLTIVAAPILVGLMFMTLRRDLIQSRSRLRAAMERAEDEGRQYRLLADNANDMISITSMNSTVMLVTPAVKRLLGYAPAELVGLKTLDLTHPDDVTSVTELFTALSKSGPTTAVTSYQFRGRHKDGHWVWLEGQPRVQFDDKGRPAAFQDVVRDIDDRKQAQEAALAAAAAAEAARAAAADSEARYRLLAENATDVIGRYAIDGTILYVSPACKEVLGFLPAEMLGKKTIDLIYPEDLARVREQFAAYMSAPPGAAPLQTEHRVSRKDGKVIWLEGRPRLIRDEQGRPLEYHDVMRDITARKAMEAELKLAQSEAEVAVQAKADFLANMSHELRTPLTSIIGYTSLALEQSGLSDKARDYFGRVHRASEALREVVNDILDFSKLEAGEVSIQYAPTDVEAVVRSVVEMLLPQATAKNLRLEAILKAEALPLLLTDKGRLRQILLNLIGNAVKFTDSGSVLAIVNFGQGCLEIQVGDTGVGIPASALGKLFKRFSQVDGSSTRAHGGTGLGLAICMSLAERMGGSISVESEVGAGSTFTLCLPLKEAAQTEFAFVGDEKARLDGIRVLVADDVEVTRELARLILEAAGAEVCEAGDGGEALALLGGQPFDAVLLDLHMPRFDGASVLKHVRASPGPNDSIPVIAFTAERSGASDKAACPPGFDALIAKPIDPLQLTVTIRAVVDGVSDQDMRAHAG